MDLLEPVHAFDRYQRRHAWLAIPAAVAKKFGDDRAGSFAALVAYYAFFSLFPLLLVFTTILGFVLHGNPGAQKSVENSVLGHFPVIGDQIQLHSLTGSATALAIGLITALWAGLGVTQAAEKALDQVWAVPGKDRPGFLRSRLRGLLLLVCLGALFVVSTALSGLVTALGGPGVRVGGIVVSLLANFCLFLASFRFLTSVTIPFRQMWIGAAVAALIWEILQLGGGYYINSVYRHASNTYSQFALVIALLIWLHLGAQLTMYAAEINVVLARKLWPRSLIGPPSVPADEKTLRDLAKVEERHDTEEVEVRFKDEQGSRTRGR